jgi:NADH dehydrogenase
MPDSKTNVLILGGGFAGVYTAVYLDKALRREERDQIKVTLVNKENYIVFQPLLPEVISGTIETLHVISPIRRLAPHAHLHTREIEEIDLPNKTVRLAPGFRPKPLLLHYDHLVIGLGTLLDYSKVPGMQEHAIPFKYLGDALRLRNQLVHVLEEADIETDFEERRKLLTFVVAGGGFSGVECIAELNDFVRDAARAYRQIQPGDPRVVLLQSGERILPEMEERLAHYAHRILERRAIEIRLNTRLKGVTANEAIIQEKGASQPESIPCRTTVVTVPTGPHPLVTKLPCELEGGRIRVSPFLDLPNWPGVWALGDCAAVPQPDGIISPPTAQHALRQAKTCARNILASIRGQEMIPFDFTGLGKLGSIGRRSAVAEVMGVQFSGLLAWLLWRGVYLSKFPGLDRKMRVLTDWLLDIFLPKDITQVRIFQSEAVAQEHFESGEVVFDQGDYGDKIYFIVRGEVEIIKDGARVATLRAGDVFGEIALVSDSPRTASVRAKSPLDVVTVSRGAFKKLLAHLPGVKGTMEQIMRQHLGREIDLGEEIQE